MTKYVPSVTVITQADTEAQVIAAKRLRLDPTNQYPRSFERWPMDPGVSTPHPPIDCDELERMPRDN